MLEDEFRSLIDRIYGIDYIHKLREDFKETFLGNKDLSSIKIQKNSAIEKIKKAKSSAKKKQRRVEIIGYILGGPLAFILSGLLGSYWVISIMVLIYGIIFPLEIVLRKISIDILAYDKGDMTMSSDELKYRLAWNKGVLKSVLSLASFPLLTFVMKFSPKSYEIGMIYWVDG
ncbi:hypothetical protein AKJ50_00145 [candidate division MSBL1 archaeon SCGC-AAA382A13]|uniref:Uncharacterized protein n=1 Tax=candidate division MSBL1 archaeon SCGC-AAA382A13 TaxID=1698279 RepID=A0A133VGW8_9EURY|nr:hypothetical protein AKJ50_00145 [candidate division MSBL1 archaeon SCGC-AAA382A13]